MTSQIIPVDPFDFIIFGGTGDLSERKLLPSLYHRQRDHQYSEPTRIIGTSRSKMTDDEFRAFAKKAISEHVAKEDIDALARHGADRLAVDHLHEGAILRDGH
jgi:glucose-6-phosphate 1-dehydrogenase